MAHGDLTGKVKAELTAEVAQEQAAKAKSIAMATAALESAKTDEVVELTPIPVVEVNKDGDVEVLSVDETEKQVEFRVNTTLEEVTIGYGRHFNFEQGQKYKADQSVYDYLEEKGLIWH